MYNREYNEQLLKTFVVSHFLFSGNAVDLLKNLDDLEFIDFYKVLKINIMNNAQSHIFTDNVKSVLYKVLNVYRERCKDNSFLEDINNMISVLNTSTDENSEKFLKSQFIAHYNTIIPNNKKVRILNNIKDFEGIINETLSNDIYLYNSLIDSNLSMSEFIMKYLFKDYMPTINYLLNCFPELFKQEGIKDKMYGLLLGNSLALKNPEKYTNLIKIHNININDEKLKILRKFSTKKLKKIKKL